MHDILLVDDEIIILTQLSQGLTRLGYRVVGTASCAEEAMDKAQKLKPDIVLMDIHLPGQYDGITAAEKIRTDFGIPIIFITGYADDQLIQKASAVNPSGYILKPYNIQEIKALIEITLANGTKDYSNQEWLSNQRNQLLNSLSQRFLEKKTSEYYELINQSLEEIAKSLSINSIVIYKLINGDQELLMLYGWFSPAVFTLKKEFQILSEKQIPWVFKKIKENKPIYIDSLSDLPKKAEKEKTIATTFDMESFATLPLCSEKKVFGFMGLSYNHKRTGELKEEDKGFLNKAGSILLNAILKREKKLQLYESQIKARSLINYAYEGFILLDLEGNIVEVNEHAAFLFNRPSRELIGNPLHQFFTPEEYETKQYFVDQILSKGTPIRYEENIHHQWNDIILYPIYDSQGALCNIGMNFHNITGRKWAEEVLRNKNKKLYILNDIKNLCDTSKTTQELLQKSIESLLIHFNCSYGFVSIPGTFNGQTYFIHSTIQNKATFITEKTINQIKQFITTKKTRQLQSRQIQTLIPELQSGYPINNITCVPLLSGENNVGQLILVSKNKAVFSPEETSLLETIGEALGEAFKKMEVQEQLWIKDYAINSSIAAIIICHLDGTICYINESAMASWGYKNKSDLLGKSFADLWFNKDEALELLDVLQENQSYIIEEEALKQDESTFTAQSLLNVIFDNNSTPLGFISSTIDITERTLAEQNLRESEVRYRAIVEDQTELICRFDQSGSLTFVNEAYCKYYNTIKEDILGKSFLPHIPEQDSDISQMYTNLLNCEHHIGTREHRVMMPDGQIRWQQWTDRALYDHTDRLIGFQSVGRDITDQKEMQNELQNNQEIFSQMFANWDSSKLLIDPSQNGKIIDANPLACHFYGYTKEEITKLSYDQLHHDKNTDLKKEIKSLKKEKNKHLCTIHQQKDGTLRFVEMHALNITTRSKDYIYLQIKDITEEKLLQQKLKEYTNKIEEDLRINQESLEKAQVIQYNLITKILPVIKDFNVLSFYMPSELVGGDFMDIQCIGSKLMIVIADCTGHGIEASMDSVLLKSISDRYLYLLVDNATDKYIQAVSNDIYDYFNGENFLTMFACTLDTLNKQMHYSNASSEIPFIIQEGEVLELTRPAGFFIGFEKNQHYEKISLPLKENCQLFFYSDAVREIEIGNKKILGKQGIKDLLTGFGKGLPADMQYIIDRLKHLHKDTFPLEDDVTLILIEYKKASQEDFHIHSPKDLKKLHPRLHQLLKTYAYSQLEEDKIRIALEEMICNAYIHGHHRDHQKTIKVSLLIDFEQVCINIEDEGKGFDSATVIHSIDPNKLIAAFEKDDQEAITNGRGIYLTQKYMDSVEYKGMGNQVQLIKKRENPKTHFYYSFKNKKKNQASYAEDANAPYIIPWNKQLNAKNIGTISNSNIILDFHQTFILTSQEVSQLLCLIKGFLNDGKNLQCIVEDEELRNILIELGLPELGVKVV